MCKQERNGNVKQTITELWEILVPTRHPNGDKTDIWFHKEWDDKVIRIAGGLTLFPTVRGAWGNLSEHGVYEEMIPVRIACSYGDMQTIMAITMKHYSQEAVMVYKISDVVVIMEKADA